MVQLSGISSLTPTTVTMVVSPLYSDANVLPAAFAVPNIFSAKLRDAMAVAPVPVPHVLLEPEISLSVKNSIPGLPILNTGTVKLRSPTFISIWLRYGLM